MEHRIRNGGDREVMPTATWTIIILPVHGSGILSSRNPLKMCVVQVGWVVSLLTFGFFQGLPSKSANFDPSKLIPTPNRWIDRSVYSNWCKLLWSKWQARWPDGNNETNQSCRFQINQKPRIQEQHTRRPLHRNASICSMIMMTPNLHWTHLIREFFPTHDRSESPTDFEISHLIPVQ